MKINNLMGLVDYLKRNDTIHIASKFHGTINTIKFPFEPFIGATLHGDFDLVGIKVKDLFIIWHEAHENMRTRTRSLSDMNIPENKYNDYYCFTTLEEAENYVHPPKPLAWELGAKYEFNEVPKGQRWFLDGEFKCMYIQDNGVQALVEGKNSMKIVNLSHLIEGYITKCK